MAINIDLARSQASQLDAYSEQLSLARQQMIQYRSELAEGWQSQETRYLIQAINQVIARLDATRGELNAVSSDIVSAAKAIRAEEEAAARAAAAREAAEREAAAREAAVRQQAQNAKNQRIRQAQNAYDQAFAQLNALSREYENIVRKRDNTFSLIKKFQYTEQLSELAQAIAAAQRQCKDCQRAVEVARR